MKKEDSGKAKADEVKAGEHMVELVAGLLQEHTGKIFTTHKKMENSLAVNMRLTLKDEDGKLALTSGISYATEQVKDHANDVVDFEQKVLEFEKTGS